MSNQTVWTYEARLGDVSYQRLPVGARILPSVAITPSGVKFWAEVDPTASTEERGFAIVTTGSPLPNLDLAYIGTGWDGQFAGHLYEVARATEVQP